MATAVQPEASGPRRKLSDTLSSLHQQPAQVRAQRNSLQPVLPSAEKRASRKNTDKFMLSALPSNEPTESSSPTRSIQKPVPDEAGKSPGYRQFLSEFSTVAPTDQTTKVCVLRDYCSLMYRHRSLVPLWTRTAVPSIVPVVLSEMTVVSAVGTIVSHEHTPTVDYISQRLMEIKGRPTGDVWGHLYTLAKPRKEKRELECIDKKLEAEEREVEGCTFRPELVAGHKYSQSLRYDRDPADPDWFYKQNLKWKQNVEDRYARTRHNTCSGLRIEESRRGRRSHGRARSIRGSSPCLRPLQSSTRAEWRSSCGASVSPTVPARSVLPSRNATLAAAGSARPPFLKSSDSPAAYP